MAVTTARRISKSIGGRKAARRMVERPMPIIPLDMATINALVACLLTKELTDADMRARFLGSPHERVREMPRIFLTEDALAAMECLMISRHIALGDVDTARQIVADFIKDYVPRL